MKPVKRWTSGISWCPTIGVSFSQELWSIRGRVGQGGNDHKATLYKAAGWGRLELELGTVLTGIGDGSWALTDATM